MSHDPHAAGGRPQGSAGGTERGAPRPTRHLRVGVLLGVRRSTVVSVWLVDAASVPTRGAGHPIVTRVDLGQRVVEVARYPDPRVQRSTMREGVGHHFAVHGEGVVYINVPFGAAGDLLGLRIRVADVSGVDAGPMTADALAELFDEPPRKLGRVGELGLAELQACRDWASVASSIGMQETSGRFEIFTDKAGLYRWRLRRAGGEIVAVSGQGFSRRDQCEAELAWVRSNASAVGVVSLDIAAPPVDR